MRGARLLALLILPIAACGGSTTTTMKEVPAPVGPTTGAIAAADLRNRIAIFADDSMQGRRTGTPGNVKGNAYIASELFVLAAADDKGDVGKALKAAGADKAEPVARAVARGGPKA